MNKLYTFKIISGLFLLLSFLSLAGCYAIPEEYLYEEETPRYRRERPVYDYEIEYEQALRYRTNEPRAHRRRSLPPWTEEHERAWQRQRERRSFSQSIEVDESAPIYLGLTSMPARHDNGASRPERSAFASKASGRSGLSYPERKGEMTEKVKEKREPQSQQQNVFILVFPSQKEVAQTEKRSEEGKDEKIENAKAETPEKQAPKEKESVSEIPKRRSEIQQPSEKVSAKSPVKRKRAYVKGNAQVTKKVQKEELTLQPPTPPDYIDFWLYIRNGTLRANRYSPINYPGKIRVESYRREGGLVVVTLASTFNPKVKWKLVLPRADGEHNVKAILVSK